MGGSNIRLPAGSQPACDADEALVVCHGTVGGCEERFTAAYSSPFTGISIQVPPSDTAVVAGLEPPLRPYGSWCTFPGGV